MITQELIFLLIFSRAISDISIRSIAIDGTNNILTYVDGKLSVGAAVAGPSTTTDDSSVLRIGRESATDKNLLHGKITSVKIYDRALSAKEISQNYNAQRGRFGV